MNTNKIEATGVMVIDSQGKILCLHRKTEFREGEKYGIPGGAVRENMGILGSAIYKLKNEIGVGCDENKLLNLGKFEYVVEGVMVTFYLFVLNIGDQYSFKFKLNTEGHDDFIWEFPVKLLKRDDLMTSMYLLLPAVIKFLSPTL